MDNKKTVKLELDAATLEILLLKLAEALVFIEEQNLDDDEDGTIPDSFRYETEGFVKEVINNIGDVHETIMMATDGYQETTQ